MRRWKIVAAAVTAFTQLAFATVNGWAQPMIFPATSWQTGTPESQNVNSLRLESALEFLRRELANSDGIDELVIIRNGRMIWEGPESDRVHVVYSMTKSFATTALGLLVDDGVVSLDTLAMEYVPDLAAEYPDVNLRHLATHTSGYRAEEEDYPLQAGYFLPEDPLTPGSPLYAPGSRYLYSPTAMEQMMNVLTRAAGERMQDFFQQRIGGPIGLDPLAWDWYDYPTADGLVAEAGSWGISMSARDAARLGHLFLNRGVWNGEQLVSSEWVEAATSVQVPASLVEHPNSYSLPLGGVYGYGWWVNGTDADGERLFPEAPPLTFAALGARQNNTFVIPEWNMVITREGTRISAADWGSFLGQVESALLPATSGIYTDAPPVALYEVLDETFDNVGDSIKEVAAASFSSIGEIDSTSNNHVSRLVTKFALPTRDALKPVLAKATLSVYPVTIQGDLLHPLSVWHSQSDNDTIPLPSDFEDASYIDTQQDILQPDDLRNAFYEIDVTDFVLADYRDDPSDPISAFRFQIDEAVFIEDGSTNRYAIAMPLRFARPQLLLTFIPEPSSPMLGLIVTLWSFGYRYQRSSPDTKHASAA